MSKKQLVTGGDCFIRRPETSFSGKILELREGWARVIGHGDHEGTLYDEWFPIDSKCCSVEPA